MSVPAVACLVLMICRLFGIFSLHFYYVYFMESALFLNVISKHVTEVKIKLCLVLNLVSPIQISRKVEV
jgi:hypothetical protein